MSATMPMELEMLLVPEMHLVSLNTHEIFSADSVFQPSWLSSSIPLYGPGTQECFTRE